MKKNTKDDYKFSEHAIIQALNFNEQLRFCTFSIQTHIVNFDPRAKLTRTYDEKNSVVHLEFYKVFPQKVRDEPNGTFMS